MTATARASAMVASARSASSPVMANTSSLASSLRRRSHTATVCARRRNARRRSRNPVRRARPAALSAMTNDLG
ncbi:MAG: hypothetical protein ACYDEN_07515 [Acidimicrobiales bacterium]